MATKTRKTFEPPSRHTDLLVQELLNAFKEAYLALRKLAKSNDELHFISETLYKARNKALNLLHEAKDA